MYSLLKNVDFSIATHVSLLEGSFPETSVFYRLKKNKKRRNPPTKIEFEEILSFPYCDDASQHSQEFRGWETFGGVAK